MGIPSDFQVDTGFLGRDKIILILGPDACQPVVEFLADAILEKVSRHLALAEGDDLLQTPYASNKDTEISMQDLSAVSTAANLLFAFVKEVHSRSTGHFGLTNVRRLLTDNAQIARALWGATLFVDSFYGPDDLFGHPNWAYLNWWLLGKPEPLGK